MASGLFCFVCLMGGMTLCRGLFVLAANLSGPPAALPKTATGCAVAVPQNGHGQGGQRPGDNSGRLHGRTTMAGGCDTVRAVPGAVSGGNAGGSARAVSGGRRQRCLAPGQQVADVPAKHDENYRNRNKRQPRKQ